MSWSFTSDAMPLWSASCACARSSTSYPPVSAGSNSLRRKPSPSVMRYRSISLRTFLSGLRLMDSERLQHRALQVVRLGHREEPRVIRGLAGPVEDAHRPARSPRRLEQNLPEEIVVQVVAA